MAATRRKAGARIPESIDIGPSSNLYRFRTGSEASASASDGQLADPTTITQQPHAALPSPPYKPHPSRTNLIQSEPSPSPSPSYRSQFMPRGGAVDFNDNDEKGKNRASVHYPAGIAQTPVEHQELLHSAASSLAGTDDEEEEYDWSDEEDLVDAEAKFEEHIGGPKKNTGWGFKRIFTLLFGSLIGSTFMAAVLVTPALLLHFFWYNTHKTEYRHKVTLNVEAWLFWAAANLLVSWYLAMLIDIVPSILRLFITVAWGHVSETMKSRLEMYISVKNTVKPLFYAASAWVSWIIIFQNIFQLFGDGGRNRQGYTDTVFKVIEFFFFLMVVVCAQRMLSHIIAFAFHRTAFKDRIDAVHETLVVVEQLREYRPKHTKRTSGMRFGGFATPGLEKDNFNFLSYKLKEHKRRSKQPGSGDLGGGEPRGRSQVQESVSASASPSRPLSVVSGEHSPIGPDHQHHREHSSHHYPPSRAADHDHDATLVGSAAKAIKSAVLHDARNIGGQDAGANLEWTVNSAHEAKRLARSIYMRLKVPTRNYLISQDFRPAFPTTEAADAAFRVFDNDNNGDLSRAEIKTTLMKVYKERRFLARAMRDASVALKTLDQMLLLLALVVQFFISLSVFGVNVTSSLTSVYTLGIGASFIFKTAASNAFDSIMFLFVTHPFDTGDRCFIDDENMVVKKMGLFATVFTRWDGTESYYFNSQLAAKFITNVRRSGKMFENLTMQVAWRTPLAKLDALEAAINAWLSTEENRWFVPSTNITIQSINFQRYIEFTMAIGHNGTWQDWGLRSARKTVFHAAVQHYCRELGVVCFNSPQPVIWGDPNLELPPYPPPPGADASPGQEVPPVPEVAESAEKPPASLGFRPHMNSNIVRARTRARDKKAAMLASGGGDGN